MVIGRVQSQTLSASRAKAGTGIGPENLHIVVLWKGSSKRACTFGFVSIRSTHHPLQRRGILKALNTISIRLDVPNVWEKPSSARPLVSRFRRRMSNCVSIKIVCYSQKATDQSSDRLIPRNAGLTSCWSRWQSKCNLPWSQRSSVPQGPAAGKVGRMGLKWRQLV